MKYLTVIIFILFSCSKYTVESRQIKDNCKQFKSDIQKSWAVDAEKKGLYHTTDSFLINLDTKYKYCIFNKDSASLVSKLGPCVKTTFHNIRRQEIDSLHLTHSLIYRVCTESCTDPKSSYGIEAIDLEFFVDTKGKIKLYHETKLYRSVIQ